MEYKFSFFSSQITLQNQEHQQKIEHKTEEIQFYMQTAHNELQNFIRKIRQENANSVYFSFKDY